MLCRCFPVARRLVSTTNGSSNSPYFDSAGNLILFDFGVFFSQAEPDISALAETQFGEMPSPTSLSH